MDKEPCYENAARLSGVSRHLLELPPYASAMLVQKDSLRRVVALCKAEGKRVVIGGPYVTTSAEHLPEADHIFLGEAETTLPEFVRDLERGEPKRIYQAAERPALSATPTPQFQRPQTV